MRILGPSGQPLPPGRWERLKSLAKEKWDHSSFLIKCLYGGGGIVSVLAVTLTCLVHGKTVLSWIPHKPARQPHGDLIREFVALPFSEDLDRVQVFLGGNKFNYSRDDLKEERCICFPGIPTPPIWVGIMETNKLYITILCGDYRITKGKFTTQLPPDYDFNWTTNAYEIVDNNLRPALQVYYKSTANIFITGMWSNVVHKTWVVAKEDGYAVNPNPNWVAAPRRIFRYPSWQHRGEYQTY